MADNLMDELECARLAIAWAYHVDQHDNEAIVALFAEDGVLHSRTGAANQGREAILAGLATRDKNRVTRHVLAPPFVRMTGSDEAEGIIGFTVYDGFKDQHVGTGPMELRPPVTVGEFFQTYKRTPDGWRIASHRVAPVFKKQ